MPSSFAESSASNPAGIELLDLNLSLDTCVFVEQISTFCA